MHINSSLVFWAGWIMLHAQDARRSTKGIFLWMPAQVLSAPSPSSRLRQKLHSIRVSNAIRLGHFPCIFPLGVHQHLMFGPNTKYKSVRDQDKETIANALSAHMRLIYSSYMLECQEITLLQELKDQAWFSEPYKKLESKFMSFLEKVILKKFQNNEISVSEATLMLVKGLWQEEYFENFLVQVNMSECNKEDIIYKFYLSWCNLFTTKSRKQNFHNYEAICKIFTNIFANEEEGVKLIIELFSVNIDRSTDVVKTLSGIKNIIFGGNNKVPLADIYRKHGEDVAAEAAKLCILKKETSLERILEHPNIKALKKRAEYEATERANRFIEEEGEREKRRETPAKTSRKQKKGSKQPEVPKDAENSNPENTEDDTKEEPGVVVDAPKPESCVIRKKYSIAWRVARWQKRPERIKEIFDQHGPDKYRGQSIEEIVFQKNIHDLGPAIKVLEEDSTEHFFFPTEKGVSALAQLVIEGVARKGVLEIGIEKETQTIYHLMFKETQLCIERALEIIKPAFSSDEDAANDRNELPFECPGGCKTTRTEKGYVVQWVNCKDDTRVRKTLRIYAYRGGL